MSYAQFGYSSPSNYQTNSQQVSYNYYIFLYNTSPVENSSEVRNADKLNISTVIQYSFKCVNLQVLISFIKVARLKLRAMYNSNCRKVYIYFFHNSHKLIFESNTIYMHKRW